MYSVEVTDNGVVFLYTDNGENSVFLVGSMNGWDVKSTPMNLNKSGFWSVTLKLDAGKYQYKFIVDGEWKIDESNLDVEDDGYGGFNSVIEINSNRKLVQKSRLDSNGIKSSFNQKIYFKGRYYSENNFIKETSDRFMLNKPLHDLDLGINVKFNSDFKGYTLLNVNNTQEGVDMWKTHFNYKRTHLKLNADYINVEGFDNFSVVTFDDPLSTLGNIGYNDYDFGYNYSGVYIETSDLLSSKIISLLPLFVRGQVVFADKNGYNTDGTYQEDDISANRIKFTVTDFFNSQFSLGVSSYEYRTKVSDNFIQFHSNNAADLLYIKELYGSGWKDKMRIELSAEYSEYDNINDQDSLETTWMEGEIIFFGLSVQFPAALNMYISHTKNSFDLGLEFNREKIDFGLDYSANSVDWKLSGEFWKNNFSDYISWVDYYKYVEKTDGNGRWFQEYSEVQFEKYTIMGYETGFLWESNLNYSFSIVGNKLETTLKNKFAHHDFFTEPKFIENIFIVKYFISDRWRLTADTRVPYYNDAFLDLKTDFSNEVDVFISNYTEIAYFLSKDIWLAIGYGVNPMSIDPVTDRFHYQGREEYLNSVGQLPGYIESYYGGFGNQIRSSEESLMNEKNISIQAVMEF